MNRIRELRQSQNMKQADLAKILKCAPTAVSKYELEQLDLSSQTIHHLCDIFCCTSDYLLGRSILPNAELSEGEAELLMAYRAADQNIRTGIRALLEPYIEKDASSAS